jgi:hypothetical protein
MIPATYSHAVYPQALAFARSEWEKNICTKTPWSLTMGVKGAGAEDFGRGALRQILPALLQTYDGRCKIIELAKAGYREADDFLADLEIELRSRHQALPVEIEEYSIAVRRRRSNKWPKVRGRKWLDNLGRNFAITLTIAAVLDRFPGLRPTQSSAREILACQIVAEVIDRSYDAVVKVWKEFSGIAPTIPG